MSLEVIRSVLAWCALINIGLLSIWLLFFIIAHDWLYKLHGEWFEMSVERFNSIHYALIGYYKLTIILFLLVPYLVLRAIN